MYRIKNNEITVNNPPATNSSAGEERRRLTAQILSGFCANPAIFATNDQFGWSLVNSTDVDLVGYALNLADKVIDADTITAEPESP